MPENSDIFFSTEKLRALAIVTQGHLEALKAMSGRQRTPVADLLLFSVQVQLSPGSSWGEIVSRSGLDKKAVGRVTNAFTTEGWLSGGQMFGPPDVNATMHHGLAVNNKEFPESIQQWVRLWEMHTGETLSSPMVRATLDCRVYRKDSRALPSADADLLAIYLLVNDGVSFDSFIFDLSKALWAMSFAVSAGVIGLLRAETTIAAHTARAMEIRHQWGRLLPGPSATYLYIFHALAGSGVIAPDVLRAFSVANTPLTLVEATLVEARRRQRGGKSGLIDISKVLAISPRPAEGDQ